MRKISENMVPRILTYDQKKCRLHISSDLLHNAEMFNTFIPAMKRRVFNTTRKQNGRACSEKQNSPRVKKARKSRSQFKIMLLCFFDHTGILHYEFIARGQAASQWCYVKVVTRFRVSVRRKTRILA
jgi:hypothetical protein